MVISSWNFSFGQLDIGNVHRHTEVGTKFFEDSIANGMKLIVFNISDNIHILR